MAEQTKIQWTDHTWNPWMGCTKVAPGCEHCYAEADFDKRRKRVKWGPQGTRVKTSAEYWQKPTKWNKQAAADGARPRVFCASLADVFEDWTGPILDSTGEQLFWPLNALENPRFIAESHCGGNEPPVTMADLRRDLFALIDQTPHLDWILLTKRPENIRRMWNPIAWHACEIYRANVWLITSVSDQSTADKAIPELLKCRDLCPVLGVSAEPLLGPIEFWSDGCWCLPCRHCADGSHDPETNVVECRRCDSTGIGDEPGIDWVIVGGESGPHARPCHVDWIRAIRDQCKAARTPCFVKQLGAFTVYDRAEATYAIRDPKGGDPAEWPADLRVREFPQVAAV